MQHADLTPELGVQLARLLHARLHARAQLLKLPLTQLLCLLCHLCELESALAGLLLREAHAAAAPILPRQPVLKADALDVLILRVLQL